MTPAAVETKPIRYAGVAVAVVLAALLPWLAPNPFYIHLATIGCINLMLVLGLAIIARAGQLSMGHGGFALVGGYVSALLSMNGWPSLLGILVAGVVAAAIAAGLGWIILRLRGVYFVLVAFAFGQIAVLVALDMADLTEVEINAVDLEPGDICLVCCDGLTGMVTDERIAEIVTKEPDLQKAADMLIDEANANGGIDNITVALARYAA